MPMLQTRREVLTALSLAGAAGLLRAPLSQAAEGALETTTVRLQTPGVCVAPVYIAEALLRAEGFTDIHYEACGAVFRRERRHDQKGAKRKRAKSGSLRREICNSKSFTSPATAFITAAPTLT